jgi:hypothetical protein
MMTNSENHPSVRSLDVAGTKTPNRGRYARADATVKLNPQGLPVAWRRIVCLGQPGSFATQRYQLVTPIGIRDVTAERAARQKDACQPLN